MVTKSSMPAARQRVRSSAKALAVRATMGVLCGARARMRRVAFQAVEDGHLHVHEDEGVVPAASQFHRLLPVVGKVDFEADDFAQQFADDFPVHPVVFDHQDARVGVGGAQAGLGVRGGAGLPVPAGPLSRIPGGR